VQRTRIKFCGITRVEDAQTAAELGVDAIGMVLHSNTPRRIDTERARQIMAALPAFVTPVGLFVDATLEQIRQITNALRLRHIQLHGNEPIELIAALPDLCIIKAIHVAPGTFGEQLKSLRNSRLPNLKGLLLESANAKQAGGSGAVNDWSTIQAHQRTGEFDGLPPIIAAGGLRPETVGDVVRKLRPFAVDVSSGIESAIGINSAEKMAAFAEAVRAADSA
jgi:phosphoribosylanthranilate isomerase